MTKRNINKQTATAPAVLVLMVAAVAAASAAGFDDDSGSPDYFRGHEPEGRNKPLPVILMHKQALQEDGGFQYAFAADNGLKQGESIRPDGSRTGAYSYTDPDGKEISVKYTAGKDGFRILQGDHVPKAPLTVVPLQQPAFAAPSPGRSSSGKNRLFGAPGGPGSQFSRGDLSGAGRFDPNSDEAYGPPLSAYKSKVPKAQPHYRVREDDGADFGSKYEDDGSSAFDGTGDYSSHSPFRAPSQVAAYGSGEKSHGRDDGSFGSDERQQPHSFGGGYAFEFGGGGTVNNAAESAEF